MNLTLDEAVQLEITRKLIRTNYKSLLSMGLGAYDYTKNTWVAHDGNWYVASREVIKYYMDPRNFLGSVSYTHLKKRNVEKWYICLRTMRAYVGL